MEITKYARTVHTGSNLQQQPGQPAAAHGSPPHPVVMNRFFSTTDYCLLCFEDAGDTSDIGDNASDIFLSFCEK